MSQGHPYPVASQAARGGHDLGSTRRHAALGCIERVEIPRSQNTCEPKVDLILAYQLPAFVEVETGGDEVQCCGCQLTVGVIWFSIR